MGVGATIHLVEVGFGVAGLDGWLSLGPVGRADLTVLLCELEGVNESEGLVDASADREIVDGDLTDDALGVNDKEPTESNSLLFQQDTVGLGDLVVLVGVEWKLAATKTTVLARCVCPREKTMRCEICDQLSIQPLELAATARTPYLYSESTDAKITAALRSANC